MKVRQALAELERALGEDTECSFIGMGEGIVEDSRGRACLAILLRLTDQQVLALRRRVPEVRALDTLHQRVS